MPPCPLGCRPSRWASQSANEFTRNAFIQGITIDRDAPRERESRLPAYAPVGRRCMRCCRLASRRVRRAVVVCEETPGLSEERRGTTRREFPHRRCNFFAPRTSYPPYNNAASAADDTRGRPDEQPDKNSDDRKSCSKAPGKPERPRVRDPGPAAAERPHFPIPLRGADGAVRTVTPGFAWRLPEHVQPAFAYGATAAVRARKTDEHIAHCNIVFYYAVKAACMMYLRHFPSRRHPPGRRRQTLMSGTPHIGRRGD